MLQHRWKSRLARRLVDDAAGALPQHWPDRRFGGQEGAFEVGREDVVPVLVGILVGQIVESPLAQIDDVSRLTAVRAKPEIRRHV